MGKIGKKEERTCNLWKLWEGGDRKGKTEEKLARDEEKKTELLLIIWASKSLDGRIRTKKIETFCIQNAQK